MSRRHVDISREAIAWSWRLWKVTESALFGSALRNDLGPDGDIDALVSFASNARWTLFDMVDMWAELKTNSLKTLND